MRKIDLSGKRFGRWKVVKFSHVYNKISYYTCECSCGTVRDVRHGDLRSGKSKSCGCYKIDKRIKDNTTHDLRKHRLYSIWSGMKNRCLNSNTTYYKNYGGRGINICENWLNDFVSFYEWAINNGYDDNLTIDRIDNNGNYEPSNCRWADTDTQSNNRRTNRLIKINGITKTLTQWCKYYNINIKTVRSRIDYGWDEVEAIIIPVQKGGGLVS